MKGKKDKMAKSVRTDKNIMLFAVVFAVIGVVSLASSYAARNPDRGHKLNYAWSVTPNPATYAQKITVSVSSSEVPPARLMKVECSQNGTLVLADYDAFETTDFMSSATGYSASTEFVMGPTSKWQSGGANCTVGLGYLDNKSQFKAVSSTSFTANP
jgi:hypothetical protein